MAVKRWATTATGAAGVALVLAACGGTGQQGTTAPSATMSTTTATSPGASASHAGHNQADVTFLQGMIPHHSQAIEMSDILLAKSGVDDRVKALAQQIKAAQTPEIQHMNSLLHDWGEQEPGTQEPSPHGSETGGMSGMVSQDQIQQLRAADGPEATRLYLQQMVQHHEGAVQMARSEVANGENTDTKQLAQSIIDSQQAEIEHMRSLLGSL